MVSVEKNQLRKQQKAAEELVYELIDGKPIYYQRYKSVLNRTKKVESAIYNPALQGLLVSFIAAVLYDFLSAEEYWITLNGVGLQIDDRNHLVGNIVVYEKKRLIVSSIGNPYLNAPANIAILMDTKADLSTLTFEQYLKLKTTKLHNFGIDKVIWILTASRQVIVALPSVDWLLIDWNKDIEIMSGITFNIGNYLQRNGIALQENF